MSGIQVVSLRLRICSEDWRTRRRGRRCRYFIQKMLRGEQAVVNGNGRRTRDFVNVEDVVESDLLAMAPTLEGVAQRGNRD